MNYPIMLLDQDNKTKLLPCYFSYFFRTLIERKINFNFKSVIVLNNHFNISIIKELIINCFIYIALPKKVVEKSNKNKENLKVTKNTLPNKSRNPESIKK